MNTGAAIIIATLLLILNLSTCGKNKNTNHFQEAYYKQKWCQEVENRGRTADEYGYEWHCEKEA